MEDNRQPESEIKNVRQYYFILRRRFWPVVLIFILTMAAAVLYTRHQTPLYRATITLLLEPQNRTLLDFNELAGPSSQQEYLNTQYKMLKSYSLAEKVLRASDLDADPELRNAGDPPEKLRKMVEVSPVSNSWLAEVSMVGKDPALITQLVNILGETFIREKVDNKIVASREAFAWLFEKVEELREKIKESEKVLQDLRKTGKELSPVDKKVSSPRGSRT